jgi:hypothetical protein
MESGCVQGMRVDRTLNAQGKNCLRKRQRDPGNFYIKMKCFMRFLNNMVRFAAHDMTLNLLCCGYRYTRGMYTLMSQFPPFSELHVQF